MIANRRAGWNFSLDRAVHWAQRLQRPLVILEALSCTYPWASDRFHRFIIDGMTENRRQFAERCVTYVNYVEPEAQAGKGLVETLADDACLVVTDEYPIFFLRNIVAAVARRVPVMLEAVDSNGLLPLAASERAYPTAAGFRRHLQRSLKDHLAQLPNPDPLRDLRLPPLEALPATVTKKWQSAPLDLLERLPIDHSVTPVATGGGSASGRKLVEDFVTARLMNYSSKHNQPGTDATSCLSPYLHYGHISAHEVFAAIVRLEQWTPAALRRKPTGKREGWWNMSQAAEQFLDQLVTWRELGFNFAARRSDYDRYESLPEWARQTLAKHSIDRREHRYSLRRFEAASTHDELWNAAQRQLVKEGRIHNYLRMLWGKKILEWTPSPEKALEIMIELNNKYALDGRDPNSYSGIFWVLGRYDRPWGPERAVYGLVRYMSSQNARRKLRLTQYLSKFGG
jgi:deoxyribodipyrimidine photo-lyase